MLFKKFVGDKNGNQKQDKWPGHKKVRAPKIQYQISRKNSSEGELQYIDIPKMSCTWVSFAAGLGFFEMGQSNENPDYKKIAQDREIFEKRIYSFQGKRIKKKTCKQEKR